MHVKKIPAPFGTCLGLAPGNVAVYSSHEDPHLPACLKNRDDYRSYLDGIFMGYKWQCVEFARRWLYINKHYIFADISMAYDIFELRSVSSTKDNTILPLKSFKNGAKHWPVPGCLIIWAEGGYFEDTGHVAVVMEVFPDEIHIIEQNVEQTIWPDGQTYSRKLKSFITADGGYLIEDLIDINTQVLGWVIQTANPLHAEVVKTSDPKLFELKLQSVPKIAKYDTPWLELNNPDESAFVKKMGGHKLNTLVPVQYICISETAAKELKHATNELHAMFMHATYHVLQDDKRLEKFNIPPALWPKIHRSWEERKNQMVTGRFDFAMTERGIKVFEYNADSASCILECGTIQEKWANHYDCQIGRNPGVDLFYHLVNAWRHNHIGGILHILQDDDPEEHYHAQYMKKAITAAGITCKIIVGFDSLSWNSAGEVIDDEQIPLKCIWKTWAWETALQQIRHEYTKELLSVVQDQTATPRLVDVLLQDNIMVYEPLWTLITSNKALLPVLWELFPDNPYLLNAQYEVTAALLSDGYVSKPLAGYAGDNIRIFSSSNIIINERNGRFCHQDQIYQTFFQLPERDGYHIQLAAFTVDGKYAGATTRVDKSIIINTHSDILPLRVVADKCYCK
ncbi:MAG: CHAP domain-containing protein [Gammaproteobacteria bacterium]|nr:CHAP domain-containing protein [Gammaproteobacteria bacterium]